MEVGQLKLRLASHGIQSVVHFLIKSTKQSPTIERFSVVQEK